MVRLFLACNGWLASESGMLFAVMLARQVTALPCPACVTTYALCTLPDAIAIIVLLCPLHFGALSSLGAVFVSCCLAQSTYVYALKHVHCSR